MILPPLDEQQRIAEVLDRVTVQADDLLANAKRSVELARQLRYSHLAQVFGPPGEIHRRLNPVSGLGGLVRLQGGALGGDFYVQRSGTPENVGRPFREAFPETKGGWRPGPGDPKHHIGVVVLRTDLLDPRFLFYVAEYAWRTRIYQRLCHGTLVLQHLRLRDVACGLGTVLQVLQVPRKNPADDDLRTLERRWLDSGSPLYDGLPWLQARRRRGEKILPRDLVQVGLARGLKPAKYNRLGNQVVKTGNRTFDRQTVMVSKGNAALPTQASSYIRAYSNTVNPVGQQVLPGYLQDFDLQHFDFNGPLYRVLSYVQAYARDEPVILYQFHHWTNYGQDRRVHGFVLTDLDHQLIEIFSRSHPKSESVVSTMADYVSWTPLTHHVESLGFTLRRPVEEGGPHLHYPRLGRNPPKKRKRRPKVHLWAQGQKTWDPEGPIRLKTACGLTEEWVEVRKGRWEPVVDGTQDYWDVTCKACKASEDFQIRKRAIDALNPPGDEDDFKLSERLRKLAQAPFKGKHWSKALAQARKAGSTIVVTRTEQLRGGSLNWERFAVERASGTRKGHGALLLYVRPLDRPDVGSQIWTEDEIRSWLASGRYTFSYGRVYPKNNPPRQDLHGHLRRVLKRLNYDNQDLPAWVEALSLTERLGLWLVIEKGDPVRDLYLNGAMRVSSVEEERWRGEVTGFRLIGSDELGPEEVHSEEIDEWDFFKVRAAKPGKRLKAIWS